MNAEDVGPLVAAVEKVRSAQAEASTLYSKMRAAEDALEAVRAEEESARRSCGDAREALLRLVFNPVHVSQS